jgi:hypothetical protein
MSVVEGLGSFLTAFQNAKIQKAQREQDDKEKKARLSLYEIQLDREKAANAAAQDQQQAQSDLFQRLQTPTQVGPPGNLVAPPGKPPSLTELLADPQGSALLLKSGLLKGEDLLRYNDQQANRTLLQNMIGGGAPGAAGGAPASMQLQGFDVGPGGVPQPKFGLPPLTTQTVQTPQGPRIQSLDPRTGKLVADLGAPQEPNIDASAAGRIQGLQTGNIVAQQLREAFVNPDGTANRANIFAAFGNPLGGGIPFTKGRELASKFEDAKDALLRSTSGAGLSKGDIDSVVRRFQPSPLDGDAAVADKLSRLRAFFEGSLDIAGLPPSIREKMIKGREAAGLRTPTQPQAGGGRVIDFSQLPK